MATDPEPGDTKPRAEQGKPPARYAVGASGLTLKEELFVAEVQVDWNYTNAAKRAGYSPHSARDIGHEMMKKPKIVDAIAAAMEGRIAKAGINAKWVLNKLVEVHDKTAAMDGVTALASRLRSLELIGRHVDVDAFRGSAGFRPIGDGPAREWDLTRLDDDELEHFERLLAKIDTSNDHPDGRPGGETGAHDASGSGPDGNGRGSDPAAL